MKFRLPEHKVKIYFIVPFLDISYGVLPVKSNKFPEISFSRKYLRRSFKNSY